MTVKYTTLGKETYILCDMHLLLIVTNQEVCQRQANKGTCIEYAPHSLPSYLKDLI